VQFRGVNAEITVESSNQIQAKQSFDGIGKGQIVVGSLSHFLNLLAVEEEEL
jgi:hypothetical protein